MSQLQKKSERLQEAAKLLHQEEYFPAVAHSAYYSCLQLIKHLWLHVICKTEEDLRTACSNKNKGTHEILINATWNYINSSTLKSRREDLRRFNENIGILKSLRTQADYDDADFLPHDSNNSILLSNTILPILKKYL